MTTSWTSEDNAPKGYLYTNDKPRAALASWLIDLPDVLAAIATLRKAAPKSPRSTSGRAIAKEIKELLQQVDAVGECLDTSRADEIRDRLPSLGEEQVAAAAEIESLEGKLRPLALELESVQQALLQEESQFQELLDASRVIFTAMGRRDLAQEVAQSATPRRTFRRGDEAQ